MIAMMTLAAGAAFAGYLCGSIPFAYVIAKRSFGVDIREHGSGNVGATNMWRLAAARGVGGKKLGLLCFALDVAKGFVPSAIFFRFGGENVAMVAGAAAILGHVFPVWLKGSGGKGVATAAGAFLAIAPAPFLYAFATFLVVGPLATRTVSAGSVAAAIMLPYMAFSYSSTAVAAISLALGLLIIYRHRGNLGRLYDGTESRMWSGMSFAETAAPTVDAVESAPVVMEEQR